MLSQVFVKYCNWCPNITNGTTKNSPLTLLIRRFVVKEYFATQLLTYSALDWPAREDKIIPTMRPYRARASAKIRIRIIPTKSLGCCALALQKK